MFFGYLTLLVPGFSVLGLRFLEGRVLHKGAWVETLLGTLLGVQDYKKVKFPFFQNLMFFGYLTL